MFSGGNRTETQLAFPDFLYPLAVTIVATGFILVVLSGVCKDPVVRKYLLA